MSKISSLILASALSVALATGAVAQTKEPLKVGLLFSLSGPAAPFGIPERDAAQALANKINEAGGVDGRKIELVIYDDQTNPTEAARGATKLIEQDKVVAIIGASTGSGTLAAAPIAARASTPVLAPNATITVISQDSPTYPWVFRTMSNDLINTKTMFYAAIAGGAKKIAIFYQEDAYGKDSADYVQKLAQAAKVEIVGLAAAPLRALDLTAQATKLRNEKPDAVLMQVTAPSLGAAFVRGARQVGLEAPVWGSMGLGQSAFVEAAGTAAEGVRLVIFGNWDDPAPQQIELRDLLAKIGKKPAGFAELLSTNGLIAIVEAAKKVQGPITGATLRDQLETLCKVKTYSDGTFCYSKDNHDGWGPEALTRIEVKGGKFKRL